MSIDGCLHSIFGASKVAADVMVQEYGRYFGMNTAAFRGGTLTGPAHSAAELHGFLAYLMRCVMEGRTYNFYGYKGKMVRDAIHSHDVLTAFEAYFRNPRPGEVYNLGGGRFSNTSHIEAFRIAEEITGREAKINYVDQPPDRRPPVVDQQHGEVPVALPGVAADLRHTRRSFGRSTRPTPTPGNRQ